MKRKWMTVLVIVVTALALVRSEGRAQRPQPPRTVRPLTSEAKEALLQALTGPEGEYAAYALYTAIIEKHGQVQPYVAIRDAEARHIAALQRQLEKYGVPMPANTYLGNVTAPQSLEEAARSGIQSEEKNVALYERLLAKVKDYPDLTRVFSHLQAASRENHLPILKAAAESGGQLTLAQMQSLMNQRFTQFGQGPQRFCCGRCMGWSGGPSFGRGRGGWGGWRGCCGGWGRAPNR